MKQILNLALAAFALTLLTACGFTPMHSPGGEIGAFGNTEVKIASDISVDDKEAAFWLQQRLAERIGVNSSSGAGAANILELKPRVRRGGVGISGQDVSTRYDLNMVIPYVLRDGSSGKVLDRGNVRAVSTFTATNDPYALTAAEKGTTRQLADDAADRLLTRIAGYYASKK